jgi:hypothetical protein
MHADFVFEVKHCCSYIPNGLLLADPNANDFQFMLSNLTNEGESIKNEMKCNSCHCGSFWASYIQI